jgi:hypothetical protein
MHKFVQLYILLCHTLLNEKWNFIGSKIVNKFYFVYEGKYYFKSNNYDIKNFTLNIIIIALKIALSMYYFKNNSFNIKSSTLNIALYGNGILYDCWLVDPFFF